MNDGDLCSNVDSDDDPCGSIDDDNDYSSVDDNFVDGDDRSNNNNGEEGEGRR